MSDLITQLTEILKSDPNVTEIQYLSDANQIAYFTNLPTQDDDEDFGDYEARLTPDELDRSQYFGLNSTTYNQIVKLGVEPFTNDCQGFENEHVIFLDDAV